MFASAFHISHYMLDYMQKYATYSALERPSGISRLQGGYIKMNSNQVIQHPDNNDTKMLVKLVVANGMKKTRHVKSDDKEREAAKPMVVNGF